MAHFFIRPEKFDSFKTALASEGFIVRKGVQKHKRVIFGCDCPDCKCGFPSKATQEIIVEPELSGQHFHRIALLHEIIPPRSRRDYKLVNKYLKEGEEDLLEVEKSLD